MNGKSCFCIAGSFMEWFDRFIRTLCTLLTPLASPPARNPTTTRFPTVTLAFHTDRSESDVDDAFSAAIDEAGNPYISTRVVPTITQFWETGSIRLDMRVYRVPVGEPRMTYGQLHLTLESADLFRRAYPGLDFTWELSVWPAWPRTDDRLEFGLGHLQISPYHSLERHP